MVKAVCVITACQSIQETRRSLTRVSQTIIASYEWQQHDEPPAKKCAVIKDEKPIYMQRMADGKSMPALSRFIVQLATVESNHAIQKNNCTLVATEKETYIAHQDERFSPLRIQVAGKELLANALVSLTDSFIDDDGMNEESKSELVDRIAKAILDPNSGEIKIIPRDDTDLSHCPCLNMETTLIKLEQACNCPLCKGFK